MKRTFPYHGILGMILLVLSEALHFRKVEPFYSWFYCFAWWSYILMVDAIIYRLKGNSLMLSRTKEFFLMVPWSIFLWLIFEAANLSLENWYYINLPHSLLERWMGYAIAFGTVLPGIFETAELLETLGLFKKSKIKELPISPERHPFLVMIGALCLVSSLVIPRYFFPLIWVGFLFLLEPFNYRHGSRSLLRDIEGGKPGKIYALLGAGLICGVLWEFWNFWANSKWIYTVPFFEESKGFEMPFLGFLGFPPFALQAYVMYSFVSLFRFRRGWEESTYQLHPEKKIPRLTAVLTSILIVSFSVLVLGAVDHHTVDSYKTRLRDAYWIDAKYQAALPKVGIATIEELLLKTRLRKERDEFVLRLLLPREDLTLWLEKARLVRLKGLGVKNLLWLEEAGIHSVSQLAGEDPERLSRRMEGVRGGRPLPRKAKIRIWIKEARKAQGS